MIAYNVTLSLNNEKITLKLKAKNLDALMNKINTYKYDEILNVVEFTRNKLTPNTSGRKRNDMDIYSKQTALSKYQKGKRFVC